MSRTVAEVMPHSSATAALPPGGGADPLGLGGGLVVVGKRRLDLRFPAHPLGVTLSLSLMRAPQCFRAS